MKFVVGFLIGIISSMAGYIIYTFEYPNPKDLAIVINIETIPMMLRPL